MLWPVAPGAKLRLAGVADNVKLGGAGIVSAIVVVDVFVPELPVRVTVALLGAAVAAAVSVRVVVFVADAGLNAAVTPAGRPLAENATVPVNPL